jgi:hypothetical protein
VVDHPGNNGCNCHHERHSQAHRKSGINFFADTKERADTEEVVEDEIIDKNGGNEKKNEVHYVLLA